MSQRLSETVMELRGTAMRGLVMAVNDTGAMQTVDVVTHDGMIRQAIEVYQPFGLATCAVAAGSVVQLAAIGADPGDLIALPAVTPSLRFGGLAQGETVLYAADGSRVAIRQGGTIDVLGATAVNLVVQGTTLSVSPTEVTITGSLTVTGDATIGGIPFVPHNHGNVQNGGDVTGPPQG